MTLEGWLSFLHVLFGVLVVGPLVVLPLAGAGEARAGDAANVRSLTHWTRVTAAVAAVVACLGFAVIPSVPDLTITTPWLGFSILAYGIGVALTLAVSASAMDRAAQQVDDGVVPSTGILRLSAVVVAALMGVVIVLMFWQP